MPASGLGLRLLTAGLAVIAMLIPALVSAQAPGAGAKPVPGAGQPPEATAAVKPATSATVPASGATFTETQLRDLPGARTIWSLVEVADPLTVVDPIENGGLYLGEPSLVANMGGSFTQAGFTLDGVDITDPERTGTPLAYLDTQVLREAALSSSLARLEHAGTGPTLSVLSRPPASAWGGLVRASWTPHGLQATNDTPEAPSIARYGSAGDGSLVVSGPLGASAGLFVSGRQAAARRFERTDPAPLDGRVSSVFAKVTTRLGEADEVRFTGFGDAVRHPFGGRLRFPDRSVAARDRHWHLQGAWDHAASTGTTWSAAASFQRGVFGAPAGSSPTIGVIDRLSDGPVLETILPAAGTRDRWNATARFRPVLHGSWGGRQTLDVGGSLGYVSSVVSPQPAAIVGELVDGLPARVWVYDYGTRDSVRRATEAAIWASDHLALGSRLGVDLGVRFESTRAHARDNPRGIDWMTILPRTLLRWQISRSDKLAFHIGYGWYRQRLPLGYLAYGDETAPAGQASLWFDRNADRQFQAGEAGALVSRVGPGRRIDYQSSLDPNLRPALASDFAFGFEARFGPRWRGRLTGFDRHHRRLVAPVNVGVTLADYDPVDIPDLAEDYLGSADDRPLRVYDRRPSSFGRDQGLLTNPHDDDGYNIGAEITLERVFDGRWYMLIGGSAQRSDGYSGNRGFHVNENDTGVLGELFENPNAATRARGRLFFERGYVAKWSGGFVTASGLHVGAVARYQDGQHFSRIVVVPGLNQGIEAVQAYTRGHSRFTFTFTLDARVEKSFRVGRYRAAIVAEAFNLLNNDLEVEEDQVATRRFRATTAVQPPRAIRLGLQLGF